MRLLLVCFGLSTIAAPAQAGARFMLQGELRDQDGVPVDGNVQMTFNLKDSANKALLSESQVKIVRVDAGAFSVIIGDTQPLPSAFFGNGDPVHLAVQIDGSSEVLFPLADVAHAMIAERSEQAASLGNVPATTLSAFFGAPPCAIGEYHAGLLANGAPMCVSAGGTMGPQGFSGPNGDQGSVGATGSTGATGASGSQGNQGAVGPNAPTIAYRWVSVIHTQPSTQPRSWGWSVNCPSGFYPILGYCDSTTCMLSRLTGTFRSAGGMTRPQSTAGPGGGYTCSVNNCDGTGNMDIKTSVLCADW